LQVMRIDYARASSPAPNSKGDTGPFQHSVIVGTDAQLEEFDRSGLMQQELAPAADGSGTELGTAASQGGSAGGGDGVAAAVAAGVWRTHYAPLISDLAFVIEHALSPPPTLAERQALLVQVAALVPDLEAFLQVGRLFAGRAFHTCRLQT
jgi:hypothetical protein